MICPTAVFSSLTVRMSGVESWSTVATVTTLGAAALRPPTAPRPPAADRPAHRPLCRHRGRPLLWGQLLTCTTAGHGLAQNTFYGTFRDWQSLGENPLDLLLRHLLPFTLLTAIAPWRGPASWPLRRVAADGGDAARRLRRDPAHHPGATWLLPTSRPGRRLRVFQPDCGEGHLGSPSASARGCRCCCRWSGSPSCSPWRSPSRRWPFPTSGDHPGGALGGVDPRRGHRGHQHGHLDGAQLVTARRPAVFGDVCGCSSCLPRSRSAPAPPGEVHRRGSDLNLLLWAVKDLLVVGLSATVRRHLLPSAQHQRIDQDVDQISSVFA